MQQAAERDRQYEQINGKHVKRKQPDRLVQVFFIDVLDHGDLKLARQEQEGQHRQYDEPDPAHVIARSPTEGRSQCGQLWLRHRLAKNVCRAVEHDESDVNAQGHERDQLDQRLEGDGGNHALMALGHVEFPCAEGDGK